MSVGRNYNDEILANMTRKEDAYAAWCNKKSIESANLATSLTSSSATSFNAQTTTANSATAENAPVRSYTRSNGCAF